MQQMKCLICLTFACLLLTSFVHGNTDADTCQIRQFLRNSFSEALKVSCDVNKLCTAVHCQGVFLLSIFSTEFETKPNDTICFGTIINHCDTPLSMDVYLEYKALKYSLMKRLYNNISVPLYSDVNLYIELSHNKDQTPHKVTIKVSLRFGLSGALSYPLVPEHTYTLPPCSGNTNGTVTPLPALPPCHSPLSKPLSHPHTSRPETHRSQQPHHSEEILPPKIQSVTYQKPCNPKEAFSCHSKEMCTFGQLCVCQPGLVMNQFSGFCDLPDAKPEMPSHSDNPKKKKIQVALPHNTTVHLLSDNLDSSTVRNSALISGLSIGAAVLFATIILVAFIIWKRQKNQTSHVPLIDNEEVVI